VKLYLSVWPVQVRKIKCGEEGRKEEKSHLSLMRGATPNGQIPTKLGNCVLHTDVIKHAKFHRYNLIGLEL